jgi:hypothetical protein
MQVGLYCASLCYSSHEKTLVHLSSGLSSVPSSVRGRLCGKEEAGDGGSTAASGPCSQPNAAAIGGGYRALCSDQAGECQHGILPLPAGHDEDRFKDRTHGHSLQEDARAEMMLGFRGRPLQASCHHSVGSRGTP